MSCNGCRVLRKGCSETCLLRSCLQWIDTPQAQGHATLFVAKFFGRAGLMSFISAVPESQRAALFRSLLYEACGRTVNPINGAVGLLWTGNWHVCQAAVDTVLQGGSLQPIPTLLNGEKSPSEETYSNLSKLKLNHNFRFSNLSSKVSQKRKRSNDQVSSTNMDGLDLGLKTNQADTVSMNSEEESVMTTATLLETGGNTKLLNLFV